MSMEISFEDKKLVLDTNLELIKIGQPYNVIVIQEKDYDMYVNYLTEQEDYESLTLLRDNKEYLLGNTIAQ